MIGIVSYGFYIPKYRISVEDISGVWKKNPRDIKNSLNISEKAVAGVDEDSLTMAYESASFALNQARINKKEIQAVFFGSESPPYAVNPASTILAEFLGIEGQYLASDMQFACKATTGAVISAVSLIKSKVAPYVLLVASDKATAKPHDALEYTAASGSVSLVLGDKNVAVEIVDYSTFSSDTPDFWRREGMRYPSHGGRFSGKPSYFYHITKSSQITLAKTKLRPDNFTYAVFHMPNGKFPLEVGTSLGFKKEQIIPSLVVSYLGNSYTASGLMGLVAILAQAKKNDLIFFASYGSGAGSDSFVLRVTENISRIRSDFKKIMEHKKMIDYSTYLKFMHII